MNTLDHLAREFKWKSYGLTCDGKSKYEVWNSLKPEEEDYTDSVDYIEDLYDWYSMKPETKTDSLINLSTSHLKNILEGGYVKNAPHYKEVIKYILETRK